MEKQFINPTNMSIAELVAGSPDHKKAIQVLTKWYSNMIGVEPETIKQIIIVKSVVFPIFHTDKLEDIIERYAKMFPLEAKVTAEAVKDMRDDNPDGVSGGNLLRSIMSIPPMLKAAIAVNYGDKYFSDKKCVRNLARLLPKFCQCNVGKL